MRIRRQGSNHLDESHLYPIQSLGAIWSSFTAEIAQGLRDSSTSVLSSSDSTMVPSSVTPALTKTTTVATILPVSTVIVDTTILRTSFVTVLWTTDLVRTSATNPTSPIASANQPVSASSATAPLGSGLSTGVPSSVVSAALSTASAGAPAAVVTSSPSDATTASSPPMNTSANLSTTPSDRTSSLAPMRKHAIVGGLSGAVAGLVLIGVIIFFCLRRRRRAQEEESESITEKAVRPAIAKKWTGLTMKGTPKPTPRMEDISAPVDVDEHHHIIRMSTQHWPRPFAQGQGEGFRDSVVPGQLRVVNPDVSRPTTPRTISDSAGDFLKKQRSALAAALMKTSNRSRASSRSTARPLSQSLPEITIDPALSKECIAPMATTPSFTSYPSVTSLSIVQQMPPEDPFLTPPDEKDELTTPPTTKRPSLAPLQSAAGAAGRTLSYLGSALNPFRTRSNVRESAQASSRDSIPSMLASRRNTGFSDPFDLDQPSIRGSQVTRERTAHEVESVTDSLSPYEGT